MTYHEAVSNVVDVVEGVGAGIMVVGTLGAVVWYADDLRGGVENSYQQLRENIGRVILLGLEVLIIADIVRTIVVAFAQQRRRARNHRGDPDRAELLPRSRDRRHVAVEPLETHRNQAL